MSSSHAAPRGTDDPWVAVAKILRPHGLDGTMRLQPYSRYLDEILEADAEVFHIRRGRVMGGPFTLKEGRLSNGVVMAKFAEITDRTAAEQWTNGELVLPEDQLWDLPEDHFYIHHLRGLQVRSHETKEVIGEIKDAQEGAAHDFLVLNLAEAPGKDTLLPLIPEYVPLMDVEGGFVEVVIPEGLLE